MNIRTDCYYSQELIVFPVSDTMTPMVTFDEKQQFADRLNAVLDRAGAPNKGKGRQGYLADLFGLTQKGVRKWLEGESMPDLARAPEIVKEFKRTGVTGEWLFFGDEEYAPAWYQCENEAKTKYETKRLYFIPIIPLDVKPIRQFINADGPVEAEEYFKTDNRFGDDAFAIKITSNHNRPVGSPGDIIVIDPDVPPSVGKYVLVQFNESVDIMRYDRIGDEYYFNPDIESIPLIKISPELNENILGVAVFRAGKCGPL